MPIDSVEIKLERKGVDISPDYNIILRGDGTVLYEGINNVAIKGNVESKISKDDFISILSDFKKHGFFSYNDRYPVINSDGRPYNILSISIPSDGNEKSKSVVFYHNDNNAPSGLKEISDKIDRVVNSSRWIDDTKDFEKQVDSVIKDTDYKPKSISYKPKINIPVKIVALFVIAIVIVGSISFLFMSGFFTNDNSSNDDAIDYDPIYYNFPDISSFEKGEEVNLNYILGNVTHNNQTRIKSNIYVKKNGDILKNYYDEFNSNESRSLYNLNFSFTIDDSWDEGSYQIYFDINDEIADNNIIKTLDFNVTRVSPKILVLTTASNIRKYKDYDVKTFFDASDPVFVYLEYTGINTTNNNILSDIFLEINVTSDNKVYYSNTTYKTIVKNNTHAWWFMTNESWPVDKIYSVEIDLLDRNTGLSVSDITYFYIE